MYDDNQYEKKYQDSIPVTMTSINTWTKSIVIDWNDNYNKFVI